jgi:hypothetical protein
MEDKKNMKKSSKKLIGGLMIGMLLATIGVALAREHTNDTTGTFTERPQFKGGRCMGGPLPFFYNLTDEQQTEIDALRQQLMKQNATATEIRTAIQAKLDEFGVFDKQLDSEIQQTEQQLQILNREKELRNLGYGWDTIQQTIHDEFNVTTPIGADYGHFGHGFGRGSYNGPYDFIPDNASDQ